MGLQRAAQPVGILPGAGASVGSPIEQDDNLIGTGRPGNKRIGQTEEEEQGGECGKKNQPKTARAESKSSVLQNQQDTQTQKEKGGANEPYGILAGDDHTDILPDLGGGDRMKEMIGNLSGGSLWLVYR